MRSYAHNYRGSNILKWLTGQFAKTGKLTG